jgi:glucose uptake protein
MICWGSWANTQKLARNWRFELFYFDYAFGVLLLSILAAFTFGTMGFDGFLFLDDIQVAGKRNMAYGFAGGVVFNLANMLLVAAISVAGLSVAFPVGIGLALVIGSILNYLINPQANPLLLFAGVGLVLGAIIVDALAYKSWTATRAGVGGTPSKAKGGPRQTGSKGILLSLAAGVLMGLFYPLVELGKSGPTRLGPYSIAVVFSLAVFLSTFFFNPFFMFFPVQGKPVEFRQYFRGTWRHHLLGVAGGIIWCTGAVANFVASSADPEIQVGPAVSYAMGQGATLISALWGLLLWKEFAGADTSTRRLIFAMLALFVAGLAMVSLAPLYA